MDIILKQRLFATILRMQRLRVEMPNDYDVQMNELVILRKIEEDDREGINVSEIQRSLYISKPAVSKMLNVLERKGYINRQIAPNDRRKIAVFLTDRGKEIIIKLEQEVNTVLEKIIIKFGEDKAEQLYVLCNELAGILEEEGGSLLPAKSVREE